MNNIIIRLEKKEHYVLNQLRNDKAFVPELDFVIEKDGKLIGQIYL